MPRRSLDGDWTPSPVVTARLDAAARGALAALARAWGCTPSEAIRRALVLAHAQCGPRDAYAARTVAPRLRERAAAMVARAEVLDGLAERTRRDAEERERAELETEAAAEVRLARRPRRT